MDVKGPDFIRRNCDFEFELRIEIISNVLGYQSKDSDLQNCSGKINYVRINW